MSARVLRTVVLASLVSGLACTDRPDSTPTEPQFAPTAVCDFKAISTDVRNYFVVADEKKVLAIVDNMATACKNNQPAAQTDYGFDVAVELERVRNAGTQEPKTGTPLVAATLLSDLFKQMPNVTVPVGTNFLPAVQPGGLLGVRGGALDANTTAVVSLGFSPIWGIEPPSSGLAYTSEVGIMSSNVRVLIFGAGASSFTTLTSLNTSYGLHTIPTVSFNPQAVVFTCVPTDDATGKSRVQHKTTPDAGATTSPVLALRVPLYCATLTAMLQDAEPRTLAGRLLRLFSPEPLHAAVVSTTKGGGGGISTLSDFELVKGDSLQHTFDTQPADNFINQPITVVLKVVALGTGNTQVPVEGVSLSLTVVGNQGSFNVTPPVPTGITGDDGKATITFSLDKTGGYTISSGATLGGYTIPSATSLMFHIKQ
jgi:hypothetical protein